MVVIGMSNFVTFFLKVQKKKNQRFVVFFNFYRWGCRCCFVSLYPSYSCMYVLNIKHTKKKTLCIFVFDNDSVLFDVAWVSVILFVVFSHSALVNWLMSEQIAASVKHGGRVALPVNTARTHNDFDTPLTATCMGLCSVLQCDVLFFSRLLRTQAENLYKSTDRQTVDQQFISKRIRGSKLPFWYRFQFLFSNRKHPRHKTIILFDFFFAFWKKKFVY